LIKTHNSFVTVVEENLYDAAGCGAVYFHGWRWRGESFEGSGGEEGAGVLSVGGVLLRGLDLVDPIDLVDGV
jgi:hypothetical protein